MQPIANMKSYGSLPLSLLIPVILASYFLVPTLSTFVVRSPATNFRAFETCFKHHFNSSITPLDQILHVSTENNTSSRSSLDTIFRAYIRNERFNLSTTPKPLAIITPLEETHVPPAVICAKHNGFLLRIRSGGHDYEGLSYLAHEPFILLDLFNLRSIKVDTYSDTAWAQAGATLGELYYSIANESSIHAFPAGVCTTLGLGGHIGGGGYGNLLRKFGLSVDNVVDARIVDSSGRILDREAMGEDLFWAIRGGGPASFGVVLAWQLNLVRLPEETVTVFKVPRTLDQGATDIIYQWQQIAPFINRNLFIRAQPTVKNKTIVVSFIGQYLGTAKTLLPLVNKQFPLLGLQQSDLVEMPWIDTTVFWFGLPDTKSLLNRVSPLKSFWKGKSDYVTAPIPKTGFEEIWKKMIQVGAIILQFNPYGGKMSEIPSDESPFPHRAGILYKIQYFTVWAEPGYEAANRHLNGIKRVYDTFTPYVSKNPRQAFLNYRDLDIGTNDDNGVEFALDYYGRNLKRLQVVKTKVDPCNFFRFEQSIPVLRA